MTRQTVVVTGATDGLGRATAFDLARRGVGFAPGRALSADGLELRLAVNYLAPTALTLALLPALSLRGGGRVVQLASVGQHPLDFDDLQYERDFDPVVAYRRSKLALIMGSLDLADRVDPARMTINCVHPATYMPTKMVVSQGRSPVEGIEVGVAAAIRSSNSPKGRYTWSTSQGRMECRLSMDTVTPSEPPA